MAIGVVVALKIPLHFVAPTVWQKHFHLSAEKDKARALALRLWPDRAESFRRKKDADRAEAALIARWYVEKEAGQRTMAEAAWSWTRFAARARGVR